MKKMLCIILVGILSFGISSCSKGVSQEEYDKVVSERDMYKSEISNEESLESDTISNSTGSFDNLSSSGSVIDLTQSQIESNISVKAISTKNNTCCVFITNNNDVIIPDIRVEIHYLDSSGKIIDMDTDRHDAVLPAHTVVSRMNVPDYYKTVETNIKVDMNANDYINHTDSLEVSSNRGEDCIIVQIKNNDTETIEEIEYVVIFYKGEEISEATYAKDVYDTPPGKTVTEKVSTHRIDFDKYEVIINQAHTF